MKKLFKYTLIACYTLVLAEVFLRFLHPIPILPRYVSSTDYGIRGNTPNVSYEHVSPEYRISVDINAKGIRANEDISYENSNLNKRIVTLGDSFMLGYGANYDQTFVSQLVENMPVSNIEIINLGVSGHGTAEELIALKNEGIKYQPDVVLLSWHPTDYSDNVRSNLFKIRNNELVTHAETFLPAVKVREYLFNIKLYEFIATNSQLYGWLREQVSEVAKEAYVVVNAILKPTHSEPKKASKTEQPKVDKSKELAVLLLLEIERVVEEMGAKLVIVDIPRRRDRSLFRSTFPQDERLEGFTVYYPMPDFKKHEGEMLYWEKSDGHFTPLGNEIVGAGIAKVITSNNLL